METTGNKETILASENRNEEDQHEDEQEEEKTIVKIIVSARSQGREIRKKQAGEDENEVQGRPEHFG
ncbi:uncharacterized protein N7469_010881 [Penicillium citrinum]|uniref:Uncharacterized protein n=1 Tax=Penicillium citrinum TaxID=5077 RepID=A0A9W9NNN9_PENCI|nr:uncharacterized protein N7469_010881 [Penicillium citrinum]KAJ5221994.1 hypothetical protein N7469_010881 [Penicillium citrinum]KAK5797502.1 hypothetical protein VI817_003793 [Penicillium citrinum]